MEQANNPFQPPAADIRPPEENAAQGQLLLTPRHVPMGRGATWLRLAYRLFMRRPGLLLGSSLLLLVCVSSVSLTSHAFLGGLFPAAGVLVNLLVNWLSLCLVGGVMVMAKRIDHGEETGISDLFAVLKRDASTLFLASAVYMVVLVLLNVLVGALFTPMGAHPLMGLDEAVMVEVYTTMSPAVVLLVSGAFILSSSLAYFFIWFAPVLTAHHRLPVMELIRLSSLACLRNIPALVLFGILAFVFAVLASLPLLLGWLLFLPVLILVQYIAYRDLLTDHPLEHNT